MTALYRVALHGFSEFERASLSFCLRHSAKREPTYVQVAQIADCDFIVADAGHAAVAGGAIGNERMADTLFVGERAPLGAGAHIERPIDPERILRALDKMAAVRETDTAPAAFQHEPELARFAEPAPAELAPKRGATTEAERAAGKAEARRASRRARLGQAADAAAAAPRDVLLFDSAPAGLGVLLEAFGFEVHRAASGAQAMAVLALTPLAAAFLDVDALDLCQQIKRRRLPLAGATPPVMLLASIESAAGRVRAKLAGCDAVLIRPVTRGAAARALESCNVALPADARRG